MDAPSPQASRARAPDDLLHLPVEIGHTCRNRFLLIDCRDTRVGPDALADLAEMACAGLLADDLLVLERSSCADVRLRIVGGDRREADFCGNGLLYASHKVGIEAGRDMLTVQMATGVRRVIRDGPAWWGEIGPVVPMPPSAAPLMDAGRLVGLVRAGEPHLVVRGPAGLGGATQRTFEGWCRPLCERARVDGGVNVTVIQRVRAGRVTIRTFERGARRATMSCGTGSTAAVAATFGERSEGRRIVVESPGGRHEVCRSRGSFWIAAAPTRVAAGPLGQMIRSTLRAGILGSSAGRSAA